MEIESDIKPKNEITKQNLMLRTQMKEELFEFNILPLIKLKIIEEKEEIIKINDNFEYHKKLIKIPGGIKQPLLN